MATIDDIAITLYPRLNPQATAHLVECFGSAEAVFAASESDLIVRAELSPEMARAIVRKEHHARAHQEMLFALRGGYKVVAATDPEYSFQLRECPDRPHVLYIDGDSTLLFEQMSVLSMVGTREITNYGQVMCDVLVGRLAELIPNLVVISGLAYGIDGAVHQAALKYGVPTVGITAGPIDQSPIACHTSMVREILNKGGAIVTEMVSGSKFNRSSFPRRNRLIAGMGEGLVVVESPHRGGGEAEDDNQAKGGAKGGALITADIAWGYNKSVMAVPGRASDWSSAGCNSLIMTNKAKMVCTGDDIAVELGWIAEPGWRSANDRPDQSDLTYLQRKIMACFDRNDILSESELCQSCSIGREQLYVELMNLEIDGWVNKLAGGRYQRAHKV